MWKKIKSIFNSNSKNTERPPFLNQEKKTILVIDDYLPYHDKSSGSKRLFEIIKLLKNLNLNVVFLPNDGLPTEPYYGELIELEIVVLLNRQSRKHLISDLKSLLPHIDYAWISRPLLNNTYQKLIKQNSSAKIIFDTVDLHYIRMLRQAENQSNEKLKRKALKTKCLELALAHSADATLTVTETEKLILEEENINNVFVIPNIHELKTPSLPMTFSKRKGIVFIGGYKHEPNIDAVKWLIEEIMPYVWVKLGQVPVHLLGSNPTPEILKMAKDNVVVPGYLKDVSEFFLNSRIFVAPLRYGAGMKGKIGQSLEYELPIVSTSIGTEGMNLTDGINVLSADNALDFAAKMIKLYEDEKLWTEIQHNSRNSLNAYTPDKVRQQLKDLLTKIDS